MPKKKKVKKVKKVKIKKKHKEKIKIKSKQSKALDKNVLSPEDKPEIKKVKKQAN